MKSELKKKENKKEDIKFPVLMRYEDNSFVVLFTGCNSGTVVWVGNNSKWDIGHYDCDWLAANKDCWHKVTDTIELSN